MKNLILSELNKTVETISAITKNEVLLRKIENVVEVCVSALNNGNKILFCGNGGSAADSQHLAAELVSRFNFDRPGLAGIAFTTDTSALTAIGNDYGYERVFIRQLEALGRNGDVLFGFSTSGRSKNVLLAFEYAKKNGVKTVGMLGIDGRDIGKISDFEINIPSAETPKIQEGHICVGHIICGLIEEKIFGKK